LIVDIAGALAQHRVSRLALANSHLDPTHLASLHRAIDLTNEALRPDLQIVFPDITRKPWALRLTDEFKSGACHAGQYETSVVLSERPDLVVEQRRAKLPANPSSLSSAIRAGRTTFEQAGGPDAYFGDPAAASADEGRRTVLILGRMIEEAVLASIDASSSGNPPQTPDHGEPSP